MKTGLKHRVIRKVQSLNFSQKNLICIFEPFPTSSKVGVDQKIFIKYELLLKAENCVLYIF